MFGYIRANKSMLSAYDYTVYRAYFCGHCKICGSAYGQIPRFFVNYDITFIDILLHSLSGQTPTVAAKKCIGHPFKKAAMVVKDPISEAVSAINILLAKHKLDDDILDENKPLRRTIRALTAKAYKKAAKKYSVLNSIIASYMGQLAKIEKQKGLSADKYAHPFASMTAEIAEHILQENCTQQAKDLFYNIGKWIYLIDAADDYVDDKKSNRFNAFGECADANEIEFVLSCCLNRAAECVAQLGLVNHYKIVRNIIFDGTKQKTKEVLKKFSEVQNGI